MFLKKQWLASLAILGLFITGCPQHQQNGGGDPTPTPTPIVVVTPTPTPTPDPSPIPLNPEGPRPTPHKLPMTPVGLATSGANANCHGENNCGGHEALHKLMHGLPAAIPQGGLNPTAAQVFIGGGSENYAPTARAAALYSKDHNLVVQSIAWWIDYFGPQVRGEWNFLGGEFQAGLYNGLTVGNATVAHEWARAHINEPRAAEMYNISGKWLSIYVHILALEAIQNSCTISETWQRNDDNSRDLNPGNSLPLYPFTGDVPPVVTTLISERAAGIDSGDVYNSISIGGSGGYCLAIACARAYCNSYPDCLWNQGLYLSIALDHPTRGITGSINQGGYQGMSGLLMALGYEWNSKGQVDTRRWSAAPESFGLTPASRKYLKEFIMTNGARNKDKVLAELTNVKLVRDWRVIRTTDGVTTVFVHEDGSDTRSEGGAKGGMFRGATAQGSKLKTIGRSAHMNSPESTNTWLTASEVAEKSDIVAEKRIPQATGSIVLDVGCSKGGRIHEIKH